MVYPFAVAALYERRGCPVFSRTGILPVYHVEQACPDSEIGASRLFFLHSGAGVSPVCSNIIHKPPA
jgi:hypothetical protein